MTYAAQKAVTLSDSGKVSVPAYTMLALTLIGVAVALYVGKGSYSGEPLWCPIIDGCNIVINSPYSRIFGVPMAYFGFIYYVYMFALAAASLSIHSRPACVFARFFTPESAPLRRSTLSTFSSALFRRCACTV
jgi:uncharacterized membrane protein